MRAFPVLPPVSRSASSAAFSPSSLSGLLQWALDRNPTYYASTLQSLPILTPEETGAVAVPRGQRCALFDGVNDYAVASLTLSGSSSTICVWIKPSVDINNTATNVGIVDTNPSAIGALQIVRIGADSPGIRFTVGGGVFARISNSANWTNQWHHLAHVYDHATKLVTAYVDGVAVSQSAVNVTTAVSITFELGRLNNSMNFPGSMRDARFYNVAKSAGEIAAIYNQASTPTTIDTTGLLGMWPLQEESGTTAYDISGNGKHLTLTNITQGTFHATDSGVSWNYNNAKGYTSSLFFDGSDDSASAVVPVGTLLTMSGRVRMASGVSQSIFYVNGDAVGGGAGALLRYDGATTMQWYPNTGTTLVSITIPNISNAWKHVCITQSGTTYTLYLDGVQVATGTTVAVANAGNVLQLGRYVSHTTLSGYMTHVQIHNVAKSAGEVAAIANGSVDPVGLVARYDDTADLSGNGRNLTLVNGTYITVIPASLSTPSQDAAGNALGVAGPLARPVTVEVNCVTGDGSAANFALGTGLLSGSGDSKVELTYYHSSTGLQRVLDFRDNAGTQKCVLVADSSAAFGLSAGSLAFEGGTSVLAVASALSTSTWHRITVERVSGTATVTVLNLSTGATASGSVSISANYGATVAGYLLGTYNNGGSPASNFYCSGRIAGLSITTGGVTKYPLFDQCGPGTSNTNRDFYILGSDGSATLVSGGIVNGTISNIYANRCPYVKDHCIQYGGGIAANGSFIPGRIGSANDAAGNAKTLTAGKHGNPYSRLVPNYWSAPELVNIGYTSSSKLAPSDTVQATSPADTKFARIKAAGSDRYFATLAALTGSNKTNAESYVA